jgi:hypothetical protein
MQVQENVSFYACMHVYIFMGSAANCETKKYRELVNADEEARRQTAISRRDAILKLAGISGGGLTQFMSLALTKFPLVDEVRQVCTCMHAW